MGADGIELVELIPDATSRREARIVGGLAEPLGVSPAGLLDFIKSERVPVVPIPDPPRREQGQQHASTQLPIDGGPEPKPSGSVRDETLHLVPEPTKVN